MEGETDLDTRPSKVIICQHCVSLLHYLPSNFRSLSFHPGGIVAIQSIRPASTRKTRHHLVAVRKCFVHRMLKGRIGTGRGRREPYYGLFIIPSNESVNEKRNFWKNSHTNSHTGASNPFANSSIEESLNSNNRDDASPPSAISFSWDLNAGSVLIWTLSGHSGYQSKHVG